MERPRPQELYRHFKGNLYQILTIAIHSETREEMVVYQALYGDYKVYCRPLEMFMSEVDRDKYPDVRQKMRFEKVDRNLAPETADETLKTTDSAKIVKSENVKTTGYVRPETGPEKKSAYMEKTVDEEAQELGLNPLVIRFMDADLAVEKNDILSKLRPIITNDMIDVMAMSLGVVVEEGDVYDRFNDLRNCLNTIEKFESTRLRS